MENRDLEAVLLEWRALQRWGVTTHVVSEAPREFPSRIAARDEYIALLEAEESRSLVFLHVHGWHYDKEAVAEGKRLRELIVRLDAEAIEVKV